MVYESFGTQERRKQSESGRRVDDEGKGEDGGAEWRSREVIIMDIGDAGDDPEEVRLEKHYPDEFGSGTMRDGED